MHPAHGLSIAETSALTRRATSLSLAVAGVLIVLKAGAWAASGSVAVLASLADSALDLLASLAAFFAVRYAATPPDAGHRFGHGKAEAFASLLQAGLVFASAALIGQEAVRHMIDPRPIVAEGWAMAVMAVSVMRSISLLRYTIVSTAWTSPSGSVRVSLGWPKYTPPVSSRMQMMSMPSGIRSVFRGEASVSSR